MIDSLSRAIVRDNLHKVCVPVRAGSVQEVLRLAKMARSKGIKYLEIWLAAEGREAILSLFKNQFGRRPKPYFIAACKGKKEKGSFNGTEEARLDILISAAIHGADFVDIGINTTPGKLLKKTIAKIQKTNTKIILSYHNFKETPSLATLLKICKKAFGLGADIVKIATMAKRYFDNVTLFELASSMRQQKKKVIVVGMGDKGIISRIGGLLLGGFLTYAALEQKQRTAEGQFLL